MVYRQAQHETRHNAWPLRLSPDGTAAVVEQHPHPLQPLRRVPFLHPSRPTPQPALRPPARPRRGWSSPAASTPTWTSTSGRTSSRPWCGSELVADCFDLARDIRVLDMRASPYDLADLGYRADPIETPEGRAEYATGQRAFADRAAQLRDALIRACPRSSHKRLGLASARYRAAMPDEVRCPAREPGRVLSLRSTGTAAWWILVAPAALWAVFACSALTAPARSSRSSPLPRTSHSPP